MVLWRARVGVLLFLAGVADGASHPAAFWGEATHLEKGPERRLAARLESSTMALGTVQIKREPARARQGGVSGSAASPIRRPTFEKPWAEISDTGLN